MAAFCTVYANVLGEFHHPITLEVNRLSRKSCFNEIGERVVRGIQRRVYVDPLKSCHFRIIKSM